MSLDRPDVFREVLCAAAIRYADAKLACERTPSDRTREEAERLAAVWREAQADLHSAARGYARNERKRVRRA